MKYIAKMNNHGEETEHEITARDLHEASDKALEIVTQEVRRTWSGRRPPLIECFDDLGAWLVYVKPGRCLGFCDGSEDECCTCELPLRCTLAPESFDYDTMCAPWFDELSFPHVLVDLRKRLARLRRSAATAGSYARSRQVAADRIEKRSEEIQSLLKA